MRDFLSTNSQNEGDPGQWRLNKALAGGGCMPDVGIYCLNAARFLSDEEPYEVLATTYQPKDDPYQPKDDPRFTQVEASCQVIARFPSGFTAAFNSSYDAHKSQYLRLEGTETWAELNPAYAYNGIKLRYGRMVDEQDMIFEPQIEAQDRFAAEMDHMSLCVQRDLRPHTPGEEGLQDQRITEAIYESADRQRGETDPTAGPDSRTHAGDGIAASRFA